jgi:hypothetical protein
MLRAVIDTNVFSAGSFERLAVSPFQDLVRRRKLMPVYSHVFLEETLNAHARENRREQLVNHWLPFVAATVDRFCDDFEGIFRRELVQAKGRRTNIFMSPRRQANLVEGLRTIPAIGQWRALEETNTKRSWERQKRQHLKDISVEARKQLDNWRRANKHDPRAVAYLDWNRVLKGNLIHAGKQFIPAVIKSGNQSEVVSRWVRNPSAYPYFTEFVRHMLYAQYHAMTRPGEKIDINAQQDGDLMIHLINADALVSNEVGYLRSAFDALWRPRGKVLFTCEEFVRLLQRM